MSERTRESLVPRNFFGELDPFRDLFRSPVRWSRPFPGGVDEVARWAPPIDIAESADGYTISVELPGTKKEDVEVECHDNLLTIKGEKRNEREVDEAHRHHAERSYGSFNRSVRLPQDASGDIKARFGDGVLTIEIPKAEERKPRSVPIQS